MNGNVIRTITIRGTSEGLDKVTADLNKLASAQENVAVVSEQSAKRVLSLEDAWKKQTMRLDEAARAQANIARETKIADAALREGLATQAQHAQRMEQINQRYATTTKATADFGKQTGLARHELINLGRQAQDVGVSLVSGQSPLMVLAQQGSQIADVFISSGKSVKEFFNQAVGWAGRFVTSTAGVVTGLAAIGAGALYMGQSFASAQKDIERALSATGRASGMTRGGINEIAQGAAGGAMSVDQAREAATAFAATGRIYGENVKQATELTRDFARAMGVDTAEATKTMAAALLDPSKGALDLEKQLNFLDATTLNYIRTLQSTGDLQGAQKAMMDALNVSVQKQMGFVGSATDAWNVFKATISDVMDAVGKAGAGLFELGTGIEAGGFSDEQRLGRAQQKQQALRGVDTGGMSTVELYAYADAVGKTEAEVARLQARLDAFAASTADAKFTQMGLSADAYARSLFPAIEQTEQLRQKVAALEQLKMDAQMRGGDLTPIQQAALDVANKMLAVSQEQVEVERRKAEVFNETAARYPEVSAAVAQILDLQKAQLAVASAVDEIARANAQHELDILTAKQQGLAVSEATLVADGKRAQTLAAINQVEYKLSSYEKSQGMKSTWKDAEEGLTKTGDAAEKTSSAIVPVFTSLEQMRKSTIDSEGALKSWSAMHDDAVLSANSLTNSIERETAALNDAVLAQRAYFANLDKMSYVPTIAQSLGAELFQSKQGGYSQFNPAGYTSSFKTPEYYAAVGQFGQGGFDENTGMPNAQGYEYAFNRAITKAGSIAGAVNQQLSKGVVSGGAIDTGMVGTLTQAIDLLPREQQVSPLQQLLGQVSSGPGTLQTAALVQQLTDKIEQLTQATDANTSATTAQTDVLSPFYSSDPRRTHLGFRAFAGGGIMTQYGELPLRHYQGGGMATSPQVAVYGEGSTPEAFVPVPSGRIPVELRTPANSNVRPVHVTINVQGNADANTVAALKATAFQQAQAMRRVMQ